jgi:RNA polymerase sigma factor (sigma-70 family)
VASSTARRSVSRTEALAGDREPGAHDAGEPVALTVLRMTIDELLAELPVGQREIIRLRIEGCEVSEIAEKTGRAKRSVERILQGFRQQLQTQLE